MNMEIFSIKMIKSFHLLLLNSNHIVMTDEYIEVDLSMIKKKDSLNYCKIWA